jgi:Tol biopolymer transport system component
VHRNVIRSFSGAALAAAAVVGLAAPSQAAFPGRNGMIAVAFLDDPSGGVGPARSGIGLLRADRGPAQKRSEVIACTDDRQPPRECLRDYGAPAFSPNGRWIAFDAGRRIAVVRTHGTGRHLLPAGGTGGPRASGYGSSPAWSPDGKRIVFDAPRSTVPRAVTDLYVVAADGSGRASRVVRNAADPSWSVDGLFAFERASDPSSLARRRIWVSRTDGTHARAVSGRTGPSGSKYSTDPDFSPDGSRIVYASGRLAIVGTDGRGARRLTAATEGAQTPAWSPDGRWLTWSWGGIHVARSDGTHARLIARDRCDVSCSSVFSSFTPSWRPLSPFSTR